MEEDDIDTLIEGLKGAVVTKLLSEKLIFSEAFKLIMPKIWNLEGKLEIGGAGRNIFIVRFENEKDRRLVVDGGP